MNKVRYENVDVGYLEINPENQEITIVAPSGKKPKPATIVPFPVKRRQRWAEKQLARAARSTNRGQEWLAAQVDKYADRLHDLGVDESVANREIDDLAVMLGLMRPADNTQRA